MPSGGSRRRAAHRFWRLTPKPKSRHRALLCFVAPSPIALLGSDCAGLNHVRWHSVRWHSYLANVVVPARTTAPCQNGPQAHRRLLRHVGRADQPDFFDYYHTHPRGVYMHAPAGHTALKAICFAKARACSHVPALVRTTRFGFASGSFHRAPLACARKGLVALAARRAGTADFASATSDSEIG